MAEGLKKYKINSTVYGELRKARDISVLKEFLMCPLGSTGEVFEKFAGCGGNFYNMHNRRGERFFFKQGTREDRITLLAHADTVFKGKQNLQVNDGIIFGENPYTGIGADNRAGCAILRLLANSGHNILVTDDEEFVMGGAKHLVENHKEIHTEIDKNSRFCISFDRPGSSGFQVLSQYQRRQALGEPIDITDFNKYLEQKTGVSSASVQGSGNDLEMLCDTVCGAYFSIGVHNPHKCPANNKKHLYEYVNIEEWLQGLAAARELTKESKYEKIPRFQTKGRETGYPKSCDK